MGSGHGPREGSCVGHPGLSGRIHSGLPMTTIQDHPPLFYLVLLSMVVMMLVKMWRWSHLPQSIQMWMKAVTKLQQRQMAMALNIIFFLPECEHSKRWI